MILAVLAGGAGGVALIAAMWRTGMLAERSGLVILVGAIAAFYPVFAIAAGAHVLFHLIVFAGFALCAAIGFWMGAGLLAAALIAHGLFDLSLLARDHPAPRWWPAFCSAFDIAAGLTLALLLRRGAIPR